MISKSEEMRTVYEKLSDTNKNTLLLIAKKLALAAENKDKEKSESKSVSQ
jgi:hypothetical protein